MLYYSWVWKDFFFFLPQKQGAELELKDSRGWTALFHCTSTGHQQMVKFLLDNNADTNVKWVFSFIPELLQHSQSDRSFHYFFLSSTGSQALVSLPWWRLLLLDMKSLFRTCLIMWVTYHPLSNTRIEVMPLWSWHPFSFNHSQKVKVDDRNAKGETARALAMMYGYTKIASLIDSRSPRIKPGTRWNSSTCHCLFLQNNLFYLHTLTDFNFFCVCVSFRTFRRLELVWGLWQRTPEDKAESKPN